MKIIFLNGIFVVSLLIPIPSMSMQNKPKGKISKKPFSTSCSEMPSAASLRPPQAGPSTTSTREEKKQSANNQLTKITKLKSTSCDVLPDTTRTKKKQTTPAGKFFELLMAMSIPREHYGLGSSLDEFKISDINSEAEFLEWSVKQVSDKKLLNLALLADLYKKSQQPSEGKFQSNGTNHIVLFLEKLDGLEIPKLTDSPKNTSKRAMICASLSSDTTKSEEEE